MADPVAQRPRRRASLRTRIVLAATVIVALALGVGAVGFVLLLQGSLRDGVQATAEQSLADLQNRVDASGLESIVTDASRPSASDSSDDDDDDRDSGGGGADDDVVAESTEDFLGRFEDDEAFFQVLDDSGTVVATSENAAELSALSLRAEFGRADGESHTVTLPGDSDRFLTVAGEADGFTIVTGRSTENIDETTETVTRLLAIALPALLIFVALTTWIVVGRALRPVESMRRQVDAVTSANLDSRIADPGSRDEIGRLAATLNHMLDRLDAAQATQRRFISDASHELKSPLASMRQYAEVALAHPDRVSASELSDVVLDEGARLERLVQGMLVLAKADERTLVPSRTDIDLDDLVLAESRRLRETTELRVDTSAVGPARIRGDRGLIGQALRNLADNAARHATTEVRFELAERADGVLLAVTDDGTGIPEADRERIFDRFVRLDEARARDSGGSGLGLSIVREIVTAHGGSVRASAPAQGGARFEVRVPTASESPS
ncbi:signal transduction histidine kinase [Okibacterium sp. HSC-33S16]|nr:signal transduction histidine kinase [Okibacterium sp. HSC-33S16]